MDKTGYTPAELLEILRKVWPEGYRAVMQTIRAMLKIDRRAVPDSHRSPKPFDRPRRNAAMVSTDQGDQRWDSDQEVTTD